jgi:hypothetical protein
MYMQLGREKSLEIKDLEFLNFLICVVTNLSAP